MTHDDVILQMLQETMDAIQAVMGPEGSPEESRELAITYTHVETAFLYRTRDLAIKNVILEMERNQGDIFYGQTKQDAAADTGS